MITEYCPSLISTKVAGADPLEYLRFFVRRGYTIYGGSMGAAPEPATVLQNRIASSEGELAAWEAREAALKHRRTWVYDLQIRLTARSGS